MKTSELLGSLPPVFVEDLLPKIHETLEASGKTIVVLDDDPTGTRAVFDVPVLTRLDADSIRDAIDEAPSLLFLLTNSRALDVEETTKLHREIGAILKEFGEDIIVISRSDGMLRGHFPLETNLLREVLGISSAPTLFIPFSEEECLTINDDHFMVDGEFARPAHLTAFAKDKTFPFSNSHLPDYIREKVDGPVDVQSLSLAQLRSGDVTSELAALPDGCTCIVNAASKKDLDVLSLALHQSERRFMIQAGASFVQSLGGITSRPPLDSWQMQDLDPNPNGGLVIVGFCGSAAAAQLADLLSQDVVPFELDVAELLEGTSPSFPLDEALESGRTVVLFTTSRDGSPGGDNEAALKAGLGALVELVKGSTVRPAFIIAQGGRTSSEIATRALGIQQARVLGQILPRVPVWTMGKETLHPGLAYVIFPEDTGDETALTRAYQKLIS